MKTITLIIVHSICIVEQFVACVGGGGGIAVHIENPHSFHKHSHQ